MNGKFYQGVLAASMYPNTVWVLEGYRWYLLNRHSRTRRFDLTYTMTQTLRLKE